MKGGDNGRRSSTTHGQQQDTIQRAPAAPTDQYASVVKMMQAYPDVEHSMVWEGALATIIEAVYISMFLAQITIRPRTDIQLSNTTKYVSWSTS